MPTRSCASCWPRRAAPTPSAARRRASSARSPKDPLQALLATIDDTLRGKRDRALLLFAWATGGRRRSEVASATFENLQRMGGDSARCYLYTLAHSKTNQAGAERPEDVKPLVSSAAQAMQAWLAVPAERGIQEGALFRRIRKGGHLGCVGTNAPSYLHGYEAKRARKVDAALYAVK